MTTLTPARRLGALLEPLTGQVYFSPECHERYVALGFDGPTIAATGLQLPDGPAYFTSRGSVLGQVHGHVVAAAFGVFNPDVVVPSVERGWSLTDATTICAARDAGALGQLERILGTPADIGRATSILERMSQVASPAGKALYSGLLAQSVPDHPLGGLWRHGDRLRELRGDLHIAAWVTAGLDPVEIGLLTELYWGLPLKTYVRSRGWTEDQLDAGIEELRARDYISPDGGFTDAGRLTREAVEEQTDAAMAPVLAAAGPDLDQLFALLEPWAKAVQASNGYPPVGPHELAGGAANP